MLYYIRDQVAAGKPIDERLAGDHNADVMGFFNTCKAFERKYHLNIVPRVRDIDRL